MPGMEQSRVRGKERKGKSQEGDSGEPLLPFQCSDYPPDRIPFCVSSLLESDLEDLVKEGSTQLLPTAVRR